MNESYSHIESNYKQRRISSHIKKIAGTIPVVVVTGARQVGKSTMLRHEFPDYTYVTMDDYAMLDQARHDPQSLWHDTDQIIIDEAQKLPSLFHAIKLAVDASNRKKRFIISGSANLYLMEKVTESLAGRAVYVDMLPMTLGELSGKESGNFNLLWQEQPQIGYCAPPDLDLMTTLIRGFMPPVMTFTQPDQVLIWLDGYIKTYLERDLRELSQVDSLIDFRKLMQTLALRTGNILNQSDVAKDCALSQPTAHRYIKLLEVSNIIHRVPAYYASRTKRIVKAPKLFFLDPALAVFLSGYTDIDSLRKSRELGGFFETLVYLHLKALCQTMTPPATIYYWRTTTKREVDFVIEHGRKLLPIEVKLTTKPTIHDAASLLAFMDEHPQAQLGVVVHGGDNVQWLHTKVVAVPWWWLDC